MLPDKPTENETIPFEINWFSIIDTIIIMKIHSVHAVYKQISGKRTTYPIKRPQDAAIAVYKIPLI